MTFGYIWKGNVISPSHVKCNSSLFTVKKIGGIDTPGDATFPDYIYIDEGGTFMGNSLYGCPENLSYIPIE